MKNQQKIVRNSKKLIMGIGLMVLVMILNFPFPHAEPFVAGNASAMNIPIMDRDGYKYGGLLLLVLFILGVYLLASSLERYRARLVILAIALYAILPFFFINIYQNTVASGIYAIHYESDSSQCEFEKLDETRMKVQCQLPFENLSEKAVTFDVSFANQVLFEERFNVIPLINENGPYPVTLQGHESKLVFIKTEVELSKLKGLSGGTAHQVHIEISEGNKMRRL
ncbi:hypothetical protein M9R32_14075 [Paenisporosarcina quisquiliarum]|uniref:Uncharacterized protein n=1 Tax=Paenisporosarcina quisquiliarum TaxID=365346 RepID=A0A9X3RDZ7_9BACL|nr:hypothetical protein [Paenisporosarcina quisquiliarum]MCZ8538320.1 hypothetical protein [Paenisporosarcina quisquiliarum]